MMSATMTLPQAIANELADLEKKKAEIASLTDVARMAHAIADAFPSLVKEVTIVRWTVSKPFVCIRTNDVESFKDCLPIIRDLASRGWHTDKAEPFSDYHEINRRTYNFVTNDEEMTVDPVTGEKKRIQWFSHRLRMMSYIKSEGAKCRKVQVGEKLEPVYEFVCD